MTAKFIIGSKKRVYKSHPVIITDHLQKTDGGGFARYIIEEMKIIDSIQKISSIRAI